jgi:hypothetical protein
MVLTSLHCGNGIAAPVWKSFPFHLRVEAICGHKTGSGKARIRSR